jgi:hypothetical protein
MLPGEGDEEVKLIKGQGRILVMDDEESLRKMVGRMLKNLHNAKRILA